MEKSESPLLATIIFTYNHINMIAKCIESHINQNTTYPYEIRIYDDCSTDGTTEICREYAEKYPDKIKLIVQKENTFLLPYEQTQSYQAVQQIDTKYFCIIDGDDHWSDENKIQIALDILENNPEYVGFAHDTLHIDELNNKSESYIHDLLKWNISNAVSLDENSPFLLTSSRIFRNCDFAQKKMWPVDYLVYYYHLSKGPIYYYDKIMAHYYISSSSTFANLGNSIKDLNSMFAFKLSLLFDFQQDDFCTKMQKKYDLSNGVNINRYNSLCFFKKILGVKSGWYIWFIFNFILNYGLQCMNINWIYSRKAIFNQTYKSKQIKLLKRKIKSKQILINILQYLFYYNAIVKCKIGKNIAYISEKNEKRIFELKEKLQKISND